MLYPSWLLAVAIVCACSSSVAGQCWEVARCTDLNSYKSILECIQLCRSERQASESSPSSQQSSEEEEESTALGLLLSALSPGEAPLEAGLGPRSEERRSYSMEHFRWGKPAGRKRRPVKVYGDGAPEEGAPEGGSYKSPSPPQAGRQPGGRADCEPSLREKKSTRSVGKYRMSHFRWNAPPATKRYGGFMKPWAGQSHKPLLTLLRNVINKDGGQ